MRMNRLMKFVFLVVIAWTVIPLSGCGTRSPHLRPVAPEPASAFDAKEVVVQVTPVDTSGFGNPVRERMRIDLSAYFTAFEVAVINGTDEWVTVDGPQAHLSDDQGHHYPGLNLEESLQYYRSNESARDGIVLLPKAAAVSRIEEERIQALHLEGRTLAPGERVSGVLYFKKVSMAECRRLALKIGGIKIGEDAPAREFHFEFRCRDGD